MRRLVPLLLGLAAASFIAGLAFAGPLKFWINPDLGRSEAERNAAQQANTDAYWKKYATWLAEEVAKHRDVHSYPVAEQTVSVANPAATLSDSIARATTIIEATVDSLEFRASADAVVHLTVTKSFKGDGRAAIEVVLPDGLFPDENWDPVLGVVAAIPMLYPGDRVVLFLGPSGLDDGRFVPQAWTGTYRTLNGSLEGVVGNPFASQVEKLGLAALEQSLLDVLGQAPASAP